MKGRVGYKAGGTHDYDDEQDYEVGYQKSCMILSTLYLGNNGTIIF